MQWHLTVALICISLMIYDVERLFTCFFDICIYSLLKCQLRFVVHFLIKLLSYIEFEVSLYTFNNDPLTDVSFANIFPSLWILLNYLSEGRSF